MKGFIYTMLILSAIVFLYKQGFAFPDLAASFGALYDTYNTKVYHTPLGDFSANGEAERFDAAGGIMPPNYYYPTSSNPYSVPAQGAQRALPGN